MDYERRCNTDTDARLPTERQKEVLRSVVLMRRAMGIPPTIRELGRDLRIRSTNAVSDHLLALERLGLMHRPLGEGISRGWMQTDAGEELASRLIDEMNGDRVGDAV